MGAETCRRCGRPTTVCYWWNEPPYWPDPECYRLGLERVERDLAAARDDHLKDLEQVRRDRDAQRARADAAERERDALRGERDSEREIAVGWEKKHEDAEATIATLREERDGANEQLRRFKEYGLATDWWCPFCQTQMSGNHDEHMDTHAAEAATLREREVATLHEEVERLRGALRAARESFAAWTPEAKGIDAALSPPQANPQEPEGSSNG